MKNRIITWPLIKRVFGYARPYRFKLITMLVLILAGSGLSLLTPLIFREMIDKTIPAGDINRLILLAVCLLLVPGAHSLLNVIQRRMSATVGEGVIFDLRMLLYSGLAAHVAALLHQHQGRRVDEPAEQ